MSAMMKLIPFASIILALLLLPLSSFAFCNNAASNKRSPGLFEKVQSVNEETRRSMADNPAADRFPSDESLSSSSSRRALFQTVAFSSTAWLLPTASFASPSSYDLGSSPDRPIAILGAGGATGIKVAQALAERGLHAVTMTRTGREPIPSVKWNPTVQSFIQHYPEPVSVTQKDTLQGALTKVHASAIIFCASASKKGGSAFEVDDQGVGLAAEVARDLPARFILVSALAVDRPNSKSYQITNTLGGHLDGIMDAKLQGENKVRSILAKKKDYMIIRPGVLMNGSTRNGPLDVQVNQGDQIGGGLSRDELAGVVVGALTSDKRGVTVEVYRRSTATPLQPAFTIPSGHEGQANTYVGLFDSTQPDP